MKLESLLNLWHLTKKDIDLVEHLREPFMAGKEFEVEYNKKDSSNWWKVPLRHFSSDFSDKNFIKSFKSPFISSKDHIEISIIKGSKVLHQEIINNEEIISKISELCNSFKTQKKFTLKLKLIKPFQFDYFYSSTQVASILFLFINEIDIFSSDQKESLISEISDDEISEQSLLNWASIAKTALVHENKEEELKILESFLLKKDVGIMIRYLDNLSN